MIVRSDRLGTAHPIAVLGLVVMVWLASLLFGLRGTVMFPVEPALIQHHETAHTQDTHKTHNHLEHCPLCLLQMLVPAVAPVLRLEYVFSFTLQLWLGESRAKNDFLKAIAARGPPQTNHALHTCCARDGVQLS